MLHVELRGEGTAVVLLNGYPVDVAHLRPLAEALAARARTALVHLPGYGSSPPLVPYTADRSHELVEEALLSHGISEAIFVGYSFGLCRSIAHAARGRVRARGLVGLAGVPGYTPEQARGFAELAATLGEDTDLAAILESVMLSERARQRPELVAEVRSWARATSIESLRGEILAMSAAPSQLPRLAALEVPVLLRVGTEDGAAPPERSREMAQVAKHATIEEVDGVGHLIVTEDLPGTVASIERFLARVEAQR